MIYYFLVCGILISFSSIISPGYKTVFEFWSLHKNLIRAPYTQKSAYDDKMENRDPQVLFLALMVMQRNFINKKAI